MAARFFLGRVVATPGALAFIEDAGEDVTPLLDRHVSGDWGDVPNEDARENELSVREGFRIISAYPVGENTASGSSPRPTGAPRPSCYPRSTERR